VGDEELRAMPLAARRERLERELADAAPPVHVSPATRDRALAEDWFRRFEGAGLDGVMAKRLDEPYRAGERTMIKVKHARTADCVVAGFRWHKNGAGTMVGSLLLGLYDDDGTLHHVGVTAAFSNVVRKQPVSVLAPLRVDIAPGIVVGVWRLLGDALVLGDMPQVHPDPRPRRRAGAHRVDEDVVQLQERRGRRVARLPAFEARERVLLVLRLGHRDE